MAFVAPESLAVMSFSALFAASDPPASWRPSVVSLRNYSVTDNSPAGTWQNKPSIPNTYTASLDDLWSYVPK